MFISLQATLSLLLDHLSLVASFSSFNRMTHQNLAVCFGPVLLTPTQEAWRAGGGGPKGGRKGLVLGDEITSAVDFKRHIEVLHYLLQLWPGQTQWETKSSTTNSTYFHLHSYHFPSVFFLSADPSSANRWLHHPTSIVCHPSDPHPWTLGSAAASCTAIGFTPEPRGGGSGFTSWSRWYCPAREPPTNQSVRGRLEHLWTRSFVRTGGRLWWGGRKWERYR